MPGIKALPDESNARYFHVVVDGPKDVGAAGRGRGRGRGCLCAVMWMGVAELSSCTSLVAFGRCH